MKVLIINGSPHKNGCVYTSLSEAVGVLEESGIDTEFFHIGGGPIRDCDGCQGCVKTLRCIHNGDGVNECAEKLIAADGLIVGSPVYFAGPSAGLCAFLDRLFYRKEKPYAYKPAAAVVNCRRAGASAALDRLNKYFVYARMPLVPSQYWNITHGTTVEEVRKDLEGMQVMRTMGRQMAWLLKAVAREGTAAIAAQEEAVTRTNFIRQPGQ